MSAWTQLAGPQHLDELTKRMHTEFIASDRRSMTTAEIEEVLGKEEPPTSKTLWKAVLNTLAEVPSLRYQLARMRMQFWDDGEDLL